MGSYLSEPVTEKVSGDDENDKLICGHSSMQGWRISQEDSHNCLLNFDSNTSLFAVYDGHGGHEVAQYTSEKLPDFIKNTQAYKDGDMKKALIDAFLGFDATIATNEVINILKDISGRKDSQEDSEDEENVNNLYEEAAMPIEQVIEKYTNFLNPASKNLRSESDKIPKSSKVGEQNATGSSNQNCESSTSSSSSCMVSDKKVTEENFNDAVSSSSSNDAIQKSKGEDNSSEAKCTGSEDSSSINDSQLESSSNSNVKDTHVFQPIVSSSDGSIEKISEIKPEATVNEADSELTLKNPETESIPKTEETLKKSSLDEKDEHVLHQNGEVPTDHPADYATPQENGELVKKGKGKALTKTKGVLPPKPKKVREVPKRTAKQLYCKLLNFEEESEDSEEEDKTFEGPQDLETSDDSENEDEKLEEEDSEEDSIFVEEDEDNSGVEEEEEEEDEDDINYEFTKSMREEPGFDSGCTAVVALLRENDLYVANAGDSRCIVSRNGKAVEMSFDHKPEDEPERERVIKAGGTVTHDGRVNGGLNLSRALGDHAYKQNKELSDREQMITALPDVIKLTLNPNEDEFMVLACDGIWNFMSSQEVVDFVRPRLQENNEKVSHICEEMFDHCLAPNTLGDGTGCDNMTAIIVKFKFNSLKRAASSEELDEPDIKRTKTEENTEVQSTAA